jgi:hypothetical protein
VADVEQTDAGADGQVFGDEAGVFNGHIPAAEVNHLGAKAAVQVIQGSFAKGDGGRRQADPQIRREIGRTGTSNVTTRLVAGQLWGARRV